MLLVNKSNTVLTTLGDIRIIQAQCLLLFQLCKTIHFKPFYIVYLLISSDDFQLYVKEKTHFHIFLPLSALSYLTLSGASLPNLEISYLFKCYDMIDT